MKKNLSLLLSIIALISIVSCNNNNSINNASSDSSILPILITSSEEQLSESKDSEITSSSEQEDTYYHVTFVNYDETVLYETDVLEGSEAIYSGETPTKEEDDEFTYEFIGWDIDLTQITEDVTAKATYKEVAKEDWGPIIWF